MHKTQTSRQSLVMEYLECLYCDWVAVCRMHLMPGILIGGLPSFCVLVSETSLCQLLTHLQRCTSHLACRAPHHRSPPPSLNEFRQKWWWWWWWALPHFVCIRLNFKLWLWVSISSASSSSSSHNIKLTTNKRHFCLFRMPTKSDTWAHYLFIKFCAWCTRLRKLPLVFHFYAGIAFI